MLVAKSFMTAIELVKECEGLRLRAYLDVGGLKTIGYGHLMQAGEQNTITAEVAEILLANDMRAAYKLIINTPRPSSRNLTNNQVAALTSLVFNIGNNAYFNPSLAASKQSTIYKKLIVGDDAAAALEFARWDKVTMNGVKVPVQGLSNRRARETALFKKP